MTIGLENILTACCVQMLQDNNSCHCKTSHVLISCFILKVEPFSLKSMLSGANFTFIINYSFVEVCGPSHYIKKANKISSCFYKGL